MRVVSVRVICKTSNPVFTEGKDLQGNMPTMPRTDSMFDHREPPRSAKKQPAGLVNGQKQRPSKFSSIRVTQPGTQVRDGLSNVHIYFDLPGDFQPAQ